MCLRLHNHIGVVVTLLQCGEWVSRVSPLPPACSLQQHTLTPSCLWPPWISGRLVLANKEGGGERVFPFAQALSLCLHCTQTYCVVQSSFHHRCHQGIKSCTISNNKMLALIISGIFQSPDVLTPSFIVPGAISLHSDTVVGVRLHLIVTIN